MHLFLAVSVFCMSRGIVSCAIMFALFVIILLVMVFIPSYYVLLESQILYLNRFGCVRKKIFWKDLTSVEEIEINDLSVFMRYIWFIGTFAFIFVRPKQKALRVYFSNGDYIEILEKRVKDYHYVKTLFRNRYDCNSALALFKNS